MNYLIAKKKGNNNTYFLILSQIGDVYNIPADLQNIKTYDTNYKLEEDEWFGIPEFTTTKYSIPLLTAAFNTAELHQIANGQYKQVKHFCAYQNEDDFCFQKFVFSNIITKRWLPLSGEPEIKTNQPILILKSVPDAVYRKSTDTLYFKNLTDAKSIFPYLIELYREATDEETEQFLNSDFISLYEGFNKSKVNTANRKRIAMAMAALASMEDEHKKQIHQYIREYCPELEFSDEDNQFKIGSEEHLKNLIFGIDQRFYTTIVGAERRLANSISKLPE